MPIIKSAKKRVRVANKAAVRNSKTKRQYRSALKAFQASLTSKSDSQKAHSEAQSSLDKAVKHGVIHKNKAARKKRQLAQAAKAANVKTAGAKKTTAKKPAAKPAAKKTPAKKPAAKKPAAKK